MTIFTFDNHDERGTLEELCEKYNGKLDRQGSWEGVNTLPCHDGVTYEYRAYFDEDEEADDFLEEINASKSDRALSNRNGLMVVFSLHRDEEDDTEEEVPNANKNDYTYRGPTPVGG